MANTFADNFRLCCNESSGCGFWEQAQHNTEYLQARRDLDALRQDLVERLDGDWSAVDRFDAAKSYSLSFSDEHTYCQGFRDCVYLLRWMGAL